MDQNYEEQMIKSFSNQEKRVVVPATSIFKHDIGSQPAGISIFSLGDKEVIAIAAYYEPAICLSLVVNDGENITHNVSWVRGAEHNGKRIRIFSGLYQSGEANRAEAVAFDKFGNLWAVRNGERKFHILTHATEDKWILTDIIDLPYHTLGCTSLYSAKINGDKLLTLESTDDFEKEWHFTEYLIERTGIKFIGSESKPAFMSGIGQRPGDEEFWFITDYRSKAQHGIYRGDKLIIPSIYGNGIVFLQDGSAIATRYGQASPGAFNGEPGALIHIPAYLFE